MLTTKSIEETPRRLRQSTAVIFRVASLCRVTELLNWWKWTSDSSALFLGWWHGMDFSCKLLHSRLGVISALQPLTQLNDPRTSRFILPSRKHYQASLHQCYRGLPNSGQGMFRTGCRGVAPPFPSHGTEQFPFGSSIWTEHVPASVCVIQLPNPANGKKSSSTERSRSEDPSLVLSLLNKDLIWYSY